MIHSIYRYLTPQLKKRLWLLGGLVLGVGIFEMAALGGIALFISSLTDSARVYESGPITMARAWSFGLIASPRDLVVCLSVITVVMVAMKNVFTGALTYISGRIAARIDGYFGDLLLTGFLQRPYEWHLKKNSSDLVTAVYWRNYIGNITMFMAIQTISDGLVMLMLILSLFVIAPYVSLAVMAVLGVGGGVIYKAVRPLIDRHGRKLRDIEMAINRHSTMSMHGIKDVKVFGRINVFMRGYREYVDQYARSWALVRVLTRMPSLLLESLGFIMLTGIVLALLLASEASTARITGTVALIGVAAWRILPAVNRMLIGVTTIRQNAPQTKAVMAYVEDLPPRPEGEPADPSDADFDFNDRVRLENVGFTYEGASAPALENVTFDIPKGASIGVVGYSGAGKSTLVDVLIGLLNPGGGAITIDGRLLDDDLAPRWMRRIGYVGQSPYIFDGTLAEKYRLWVASGGAGPEKGQGMLRYGRHRGISGPYAGRNRYADW